MAVFCTWSGTVSIWPWRDAALRLRTSGTVSPAHHQIGHPLTAAPSDLATLGPWISGRMFSKTFGHYAPQPTRPVVDHQDHMKRCCFRYFRSSVSWTRGHLRPRWRKMQRTLNKTTLTDRSSWISKERLKRDLGAPTPRREEHQGELSEHPLRASSPPHIRTRQRSISMSKCLSRGPLVIGS